MVGERKVEITPRKEGERKYHWEEKRKYGRHFFSILCPCVIFSPENVIFTYAHLTLLLLVMLILPLTDVRQGLADPYLRELNHRTLKKGIETTENYIRINLIFLLSPELHFFFDRHCKVTKMFRVVGLYMQYLKYEKFIFSLVLSRCATFLNKGQSPLLQREAPRPLWPGVRPLWLGSENQTPTTQRCFS